MKKRICIVLAALMITSSFCYASEIHNDKAQHIGASYAAELTLRETKPFCKWKPWQRALFTTAVIGGAKEWYDHNHPQNHSAEWDDIVADAIGAAIAEGAVWFIHKTF